MSGSRLPSLRKAAGGILIAALLTKVLGLLRQVLVAHFFGAGAELDAVYLGMSLPMALTIGAGGGFARAVVPVAASLEGTRIAGLLRAGSVRILRVALPAMGIMCATSPLWVNVLLLGENVPERRLLALSAAIVSLAFAGGTLAGFAVGLTNSQGKHGVAALNPLVYNIVMCASIAILWHPLGALSIAVGTLLAEWSQIGVQYPALARIQQEAEPQALRADWTKLTALFWPAAAMGVTSGLNVVVDRAFATRLEAGSISGLNYADGLVNLPVGLLGTALAVPLFTRLSHFRNRDRTEDFDTTLLLGIRLFMFVGMPLAIVLTGLSEPVVGLLFQRGAFDESSVQLATQAMRGYCIGIPFQALGGLMLGAGLTLKRPWTVVWVLLGTTALNALLNALLLPLGLFGIALATSIVAVVRVGILLAMIAPKLMLLRSLWSSAARIGAFCGALAIPYLLVAMLTTAMDIQSTFGRVLIVVLGLGVAGATGLSMWHALLEREWRSLERVRSRAAASVLDAGDAR